MCKNILQVSRTLTHFSGAAVCVCVSCACVCIYMCIQEEYLTAEEFATVFKMERAAYLKLPAWKRLQLKKSTLLF